MSVDADAGRLKSEADEPGWEVDPDDEWGVAVITTVGRQLKLRREAVGCGRRVRGSGGLWGGPRLQDRGRKRIPRQEYLDKADEVLGAGGLISATWEDVKKVRYPKKVRELGKLEAQAIEIGVYECNGVHGLLQTPDHARALFEAAQPPYSQDDVERMVAARLARQSIFERDPVLSVHFVLEEAVVRRQVGGTMVWLQQLEHLLDAGTLRNVRLQVMPTDSGAHPGVDGKIELLKFPDGTAVGRSDGAFNGRPITDPKQLRILDLRNRRGITRRGDQGVATTDRAGHRTGSGRQGPRGPCPHSPGLTYVTLGVGSPARLARPLPRMADCRSCSVER